MQKTHDCKSLFVNKLNAKLNNWFNSINLMSGKPYYGLKICITVQFAVSFLP